MKPRLVNGVLTSISKSDHIYEKTMAQYRKLIKEISEDYGKDWVQNKSDKDLAYINYKKYKRDRLNKLIELISLEIDRVPHKGVETIMNGNIV